MSLRRVFFLLIPLCLLGLGVSLWLLLRPVTTPSPEPPQPLYILGQQEGHVAVFSPDEPLDGNLCAFTLFILDFCPKPTKGDYKQAWKFTPKCNSNSDWRTMVCSANHYFAGITSSQYPSGSLMK